KKNQPLMRFSDTWQSHMVTAEIGNSTVVVSFYLLLSLFSLLIAVGNVLPYLSIDPNSVLPYIAEASPKDVYKNLEPAI
ncbi:YihY/virulence factor BrkB family protein, partial [Enterococcus faecalis]